MWVYSALLAQYNVCMQCLQTIFNSIYKAPTLWLIQAQANLKLVSDQSESDRSETQLKIWSGPITSRKQKPRLKTPSLRNLSSSAPTQCKNNPGNVVVLAQQAVERDATGQ